MAHSIARLQIKIPLFSQIKELKILWYAILEYLKSLWQWYIKSGTIILNVHEDLMAPLVWWGQGLARFPFFMSWRIVLKIQFIQVIILLGICYPQLVFGLGFTFIGVLSEKFNWRREIRSTGGSDACIRDCLDWHSFLECLFLCSNWRKTWFAVDWIEFYSLSLERRFPTVRQKVFLKCLQILVQWFLRTTLSRGTYFLEVQEYVDRSLLLERCFEEWWEIHRLHEWESFKFMRH